MKGFLRDFFVAASIFLLTSGSAWGQATAQLNGRVTDESGGVLPGVTVTATQTDTGFNRTVATDETGVWVMPNLPIGPYRLEVSLQGFRPYVQTGIVLQVNANPVINAALTLGSLEETVTVEAAAPLVDVRSAGISDVVEQERIVELPLQGRQVTDLIVLAGSAVNTGRISALSTSNSVAISVAGGLRNGVEYMLDGAAHNSPHDQGNLPFPFPDALQEFSVATGGLAASTGMHSSAAVNAVTKSGTNQFHGNGFEFFRDSRFNSAAAFAPVGQDGKKLGDGLSRNQFGGTLGGPIVRDKLFFFAGYERSRIRQTTHHNFAFVPTAAILAGDFTALASPACNAGRQVTLGRPFVNNRIDPALLSPQAVAIATSGWISRSSHPCGEVQYDVNFDNNDEQVVTRADYQRTANHTIFGRYIDTFERRPPKLHETRNILTIQTAYLPYRNRRAQTAAFGDTRVMGANTVNAVRVTWAKTKTRANDPPEQFFDAASLGIPNIYTYVPGTMTVFVGATGNDIRFSGNHTVAAKVDSKVYQIAEDFSHVRGRHQFGAGASVVYSWFDGWDYVGSNGTFEFNGRITGLALADFFTGQMSSFSHSGPQVNTNHQWYIGVYGQDAWRATDRVTLNLGVRWDPYLGTVWENGAISNFSMENFRNRVGSTSFPNAPAGLLFPGDPGFPPGTSGTHKQWSNISPRVGVAWDVKGDARTAVRASYALNYDFPGGAFQQTASNVPPFNNRVGLTGNIPFADPYSLVPTGPPAHPTPTASRTRAPASAVFPTLAPYSAIDPNINSIRVQSWNVTVEQQIGAAWQVAASYLGNYIDRLWGRGQINPGVFLGVGPCTLGGVFYPVCSTNANLQERRVFTLENPAEGRFFTNVWTFSNVGEQSYRGLKLSVRRRAADGISLSANYTVSHCITDSPYVGRFISDFEYTDPDNPSYDRGNCPFNRRQIANATVGYLTPQFASPALRAVASNWRVTGILNAQTGNWLNVTTTSDPARTGIGGQRVNQVLDNPYGDKTLTNYLNPAAFAIPAPGTLGDHGARSIEGPGFWQVNLALARLLQLANQHTLELRVETFNLFNTFNWADPVTNLNAGTFGRITTQNGNPRIMQFAVKYGF
ncbi:MAG: TonB-dependent receptor [Acidobacteria bacterium]|nr:TonB-dependent receptor [Acidobacteriota bacterium]